MKKLTQWAISRFGSVFCWDKTAQVWSQPGVEINQSPQCTSYSLTD